MSQMVQVVSMEEVPKRLGSVSFQSKDVRGAQNSVFLFCMAALRQEQAREGVTSDLNTPEMMQWCGSKPGVPCSGASQGGRHHHRHARCEGSLQWLPASLSVRCPCLG